ncbi:MAG TPA: prephenate dehydrogenase/arogenate dehydrogenase family protein [Chthonomonadales bacterium]|nr:prephenate dehydrogenase/arogenate dehydrogenase family protein [Chthonomonadales bacterium]
MAARDSELVGGDPPFITNSTKPGTVAILGLGLMGGSLGLALRARGGAEKVIGWNRSASVLAVAKEMGVVDLVASDPRGAVAEADLVVLAVPVQVVASLAETILPALKPDCVITDVGSTKTRLVAETEAILGGRFVGGHPMAGSEASGIEEANSKLYERAAWVLTPTPVTWPQALERVTQLVVSVGAIPYQCSPEKHDRIVASLSHLPHILAYGLAHTAGKQVEPEWGAIAAGSFRDGARVAKSDPALWSGILSDNRAAVLESLDEFLAWARQVRAALAEDDAETLREMITRAHEARNQLPG